MAIGSGSYRLAVFLASPLLTAIAASGASAAPVPFTLDSAASTFQLTGTFNGAALVEQAPGSSVVGYRGGEQFNVDIDESAGTVTFSPINPDALNQPTDQQPIVDHWTGANYGLTTVGSTLAQLAVRGFDLYVGAEHATFNTGAPPAAGQLPFFINGGTLWYLEVGQTPVGIDLHGGGGAEKVLGPITLTTSGNLQTLTIPISTSFAPYMYDTGDTVEFGLAGQLVAIRQVPEPSGIGVAMVVGAAGLVRRRRRPPHTT